ncbi:MAG: fructose-6-phosphate aldolase [candidate division Zixibacteria bacterium RBG_16_53_22]|nr:MAG: fructose-6-phosphate aldolase [candidate division Zixibacteria bacterium RBG_16_53_22]
MKFFLDTGSIDEIRKANELGILDGVTTNPSLLAKEKKPYMEILREITTMVKGPISAEVTATDTAGMIREGREFAKIADNIVVKVPIIKAGVPAIKQLSSEGIEVNVTLCFSPLQALIAAKAGARFISPFIGRLDDVSTEGMKLIEDIVTIYTNYGLKTKVLVASVRHPMHVVEAALIGADICTMPFSVFDKLLNHPLTDVGLKNFLADWEKVTRK